MKTKKKVYISLPMGGHEQTVWDRYTKTIKWFNQKYNQNEEYNISGPVNIDEFFEGAVPERNHDWNWYIGEDTKELLTCDVIVLTRGWLNSPGCRIEAAIAKSYGLTFILTPDVDFPLTADNDCCGYEIDTVEQDRIKLFKTTHEGCDGTFSTIFTDIPGLGSKCIIKCDVCGAEEDVTNYEEF